MNSYSVFPTVSWCFSLFPGFESILQEFCKHHTYQLNIAAWLYSCRLFYISMCYNKSMQQRAGLLHRLVCERVTCCNLKTSPPLTSSPHSHLHIPLKTSHLRRMIYAHPHQALSAIRMRFRCAALVSGWDSSPMALSVSCRNQVLLLLLLVMISLQNGNKIFRMFRISLHRMHYLMLHVHWHILYGHLGTV